MFLFQEVSPSRGSRLISRPQSRITHHVSCAAFTIIEVMLAIFIFAMVLTAIYSTWIGIMRGTKAGLAAAAEAQRSRVAARTIEQALITAQMFYENIRYYGFNTDTSGDFAYLSMASRLPADFPGVGRYGMGDVVVRRVTFAVQSGPDGRNELIMSQSPLLMVTNRSGVEPYNIVLAKDVTEFTCEFWDAQKRDWVDSWIYTNQLPRLVKMTLGLGKTKNSSKSHDVVSRIVALSAQPVFGAQQRQIPPNQVQ